MEGNHLIPSDAEFARTFDEPAERLCPTCHGTGMLAIGMDGSIIEPRELPDIPADEVSFEQCGRCSGTGYINV